MESEIVEKEEEITEIGKTDNSGLTEEMVMTTDQRDSTTTREMTITSPRPNGLK